MTHGTYYTYQKLSCRCDPCRAAATERRRHHASATPTRRRERTDRWQANKNATLADRANDGIVDRVVVDRLIAGIDVPATRQERLAAVQAVAGRPGWNALGDRLGFNSRALAAILAGHGAA